MKIGPPKVQPPKMATNPGRTVTLQVAPDPSTADIASDYYIPCRYEISRPDAENYAGTDFESAVRPGDPRITVSVGKFSNREEHKLFRGQLEHYTPWVDAYPSDPLRGVEWPDVEARIFRLFLDWMYRGGDVTSYVGDSLDKLDNLGEVIKLYRFAVAYSIRELENTCLDLYFGACVYRHADIVDASELVYAATRPGSRLRNLHINLLVQFWRFADLEAALRALPLAVLGDYLDACEVQNVSPGAYTVYAPLPHDPWAERRNGKSEVQLDDAAVAIAAKNDFCAKYHRHDDRVDKQIQLEDLPTGDPERRKWARIEFVVVKGMLTYRRVDRDGFWHPYYLTGWVGRSLVKEWKKPTVHIEIEQPWKRDSSDPERGTYEDWFG